MPPDKTNHEKYKYNHDNRTTNFVQKWLIYGRAGAILTRDLAANMYDVRRKQAQ